MPIQTIKIADREQWLAHRQKDITASQIGALVGVHDYCTPFSIWAEKTGRLKPDADEELAENDPRLRGQLLEPVAIKLLERRMPEWRLEVPGVYLRDPAVRVGATPDLFAYDKDGHKINVQIKTTADLIFKQKWLDPDTRQIEVPLWIAAQALTEAMLAECHSCYVALLVMGMGLKLYLIEVPMHLKLWSALGAKINEFWRITDAGEEMPVDFGRDGATLDAVYSDGGEGVVDLSGDKEASEAIDAYKHHSAFKKTAEAKIEEAKTILKSKMGNGDVAIVDGGKVTWKLQHRDAYTVKANDFRVMRIS